MPIDSRHFAILGLLVALAPTPGFGRSEAVGAEVYFRPCPGRQAALFAAISCRGANVANRGNVAKLCQ